MIYPIFRFNLKNIILLFFLLALNIQAQPYLQWVKHFGGPHYDLVKTQAIDSHGNIYIAGSFSDSIDMDPNEGTLKFRTKNYSPDIFIEKLDNAGKLVWAKQIAGSGEEIVNAMAIDKNGNLIMTGFFFDTVDFDPGPGIHYLSSHGSNDIFALKMDTNGNFIWAYCIGAGGDDWGVCISSDPEGNICIGGQFAYATDFDPKDGAHILSTGTGGLFVVKLDTGCNFIWAKYLGVSTSSSNISTTIDKFSNTYLINQYQDPLVCKLNISGDTIWTFKTSGIENCQMVLDSKMNVIVLGYDNSNTALKMIRLDSLGKFISQKNIGNKCHLFKAPFCDKSNNIYCSATSTINKYVNVYKTDSLDNVMTYVSINGDAIHTINSVTADEKGSLYFSGNFTGNCFLGSAKDSASIGSAGEYDIFLAKYGPNEPASSKTPEKFQTTLFPNPFSETLNISSTSPIQIIEIFSPSGQLVKHIGYRQQLSATLTLSELAPSLYFLKISDANGVSSTFKIQKRN